MRYQPCWRQDSCSVSRLPKDREVRGWACRHQCCHHAHVCPFHFGRQLRIPAFGAVGEERLRERLHRWYRHRSALAPPHQRAGSQVPCSVAARAAGVVTTGFSALRGSAEEVRFSTLCGDLFRASRSPDWTLRKQDSGEGCPAQGCSSYVPPCPLPVPLRSSAVSFVRVRAKGVRRRCLSWRGTSA